MRSRFVSPRLSARLAVLAALAGAALGAPSLLSSGQPPPASGAPPAAPPGAPRAAAQPQPPPSSVTIESHQGQTPKIKLALPPFHLGNLGGELAAAGGELEATVRADLDFSGYFEIQGAEAWRAASLSGDVERDLPTYRGTGAQVVLLGDTHAEDDKLVFEGRLFDVGSGKAILAKRYRGKTTVTRRMAHTFADEVVRYLTGSPGIAMSAIAFTSDRTGEGRKEIFIMDYDGHNQRRITNHRSTSMSPAWSPTGDAIAYTSFVNGYPGIYLADLAAGRKRPLVTAGSLNISPTFSPDGSQIAFARSLEGNIEIFTCDRSGGNLRRLTNSPAIDTNPAWSPTGNMIAFTSSRAGNPHIYIMDAEGSNQRRITFDGTYNDGAAWSPDGKRIAYTSRREGVFQIAVVDVGSLETRVLTTGPGEHESPAFSPDGRKIVFTSRRTGAKQLYVMDASDGANVHQLTDAGGNDMADWSRQNFEK
ncbi:MAG TPA: Tol-Pal system beta propeller repeat protein TolB [Thermoanaerobaculia bacterium]|nr:Tol-Pal system beta propeller repeat protein TolB [Thermoanaerobaculia bacterium]